MPKDKLTDYSATNASNTDVGGVNIDEGMLPSSVNNAIREVLTHLKNFASGTDGIDVLSLADDDASAAMKIQAPASVTADTTLTLPDGDGDENQTLVTDGSGTLSWKDLYYTSNNLIINGNFLVDQRGNASATNLTGGGVFTTDRFFGQEGGTGLTVSAEQSTDVPSAENLTHSLKFSVTAAATGTDHYTRVTTRLEGYEVAKMGLNASGNKNTLSFYVKSTRTGTHTVSMTTGYRGGTAITQAAITLTYTIDSANTWEKKEITFDSYDTGGSAAWNTNNNIGVEIAFVAGQGTTGHGSEDINSALDTWEDFSSSTFVYPKSTSDNNDWGTATTDRWYIAGVQLTVGDEPLPFIHESYGETLAKCQRYYQQDFRLVAWNVSTNASTSASLGNFPVAMRSAPSAVRTGSGALTSTAPTSTVMYAESGYIYSGTSSACSSNLNLNAEL